MLTPQGPLQRGMQPLRLSLLHFGILDPSKGRDGVFVGWRIVLQDAIIRVSLVYFLIYFYLTVYLSPFPILLSPFPARSLIAYTSMASLKKGRRKQGCQKRIARPEGAKALRAIQKLCRRAVSARRQLHPFHIGKGLG